MRTRSQTQTLHNAFDFDEASREWRKNKTHIGQGHFIYKTVIVATTSHHSYNLRSREKKPVTPFKPTPPQ